LPRLRKARPAFCKKSCLLRIAAANDLIKVNFLLKW